MTGTDPNVARALILSPSDEADDRWPLDFDDDTVINTTNVFQVLPPIFGTPLTPTSPCRDLHPNGVISTADVFWVLPPFFRGSCVPS